MNFLVIISFLINRRPIYLIVFHIVLMSLKKSSEFNYTLNTIHYALYLDRQFSLYEHFIFELNIPDIIFRHSHSYLIDYVNCF